MPIARNPARENAKQHARRADRQRVLNGLGFTEREQAGTAAP